MAEWDEFKTEADNRGRGAGIGAFETLRSGFEKASGWNAEPFQTPIPSPNITLPPNRGPIAQGGIGKALVESGWMGTKPRSTTIQQPTVSSSVNNKGIGGWEGPRLKSTEEIPSAIDYTVNKYAPITNKGYAGLKIPTGTDLTSMKPEGIPPAAEGVMYQYTQPNGTIAYTDSLDKVPANLRDTVESRTWGDVGKNKFNVITGESLAGVGEKGIGKLFGGSQVAGGGGGGEVGYTGGYVGGIPSGQKYYESLAAKEEAIYGPGGKPQRKEFNQEEFNKVIGSLGGRASPKLRANIYQTMLTDIEHHNKAIDDLHKAQQQYGENSIQATQAKATLEHQREMADIARREHPTKIREMGARADLYTEQAKGIPAHAAREEQAGRRMEEQTGIAKRAHLLNLRKVEEKSILEDLQLDPKVKQQQLSDIRKKYEIHDAGIQKADELRKRFPRFQVPEVILPGQIYDFGTGNKFKIGEDWSIKPA